MSALSTKERKRWKPTRRHRLPVAALVLVAATVGASVAPDRPLNSVSIDQNIDKATLQRLHHTDQGTEIVPAAWLAAVEKADGSGKFMADENMRRLGFLTQASAVDQRNPYGWPIGFTVSAPKKPGDVPSAGITCAACHTGQVDYKGTAIRIEGGQGMVDAFKFFTGVSQAFVATAKDGSRRKRFFQDAIKAGYPAERMDADFKAAVAGFPSITDQPPFVNTAEGPGRSDAVQGIANRAFSHNLMAPANAKAFVAPVSFPYLWDIWRLSWVQYTGFQPGDKPQARNIGEVIGVFGTTNIVDRNGVANPEPLRWQTSINLDNLIWMESALRGLRAPTWPENVLGKIDQAKAARGKILFTTNCAGCHGVKELPNGVWDVTVPSIKKLGTDPVVATNFSADTYDGSKVGLGKEAHAWQALPAVVDSIRKQLYADNKAPIAEREDAYISEAPCGYKARPLIGVWATPPFLHNGSVRTIFDLLSETRPSKFTVGSRNYDPVNLGYTQDHSIMPFVLDTSIKGNSNAGHWFTGDRARPGRIGPKLSNADKYALIEYLKAATYDNYPSEKRATEARMACQGQQDWATKKS